MLISPQCGTFTRPVSSSLHSGNNVVILIFLQVQVQGKHLYAAVAILFLHFVLIRRTQYINSTRTEIIDPTLKQVRIYSCASGQLNLIIRQIHIL